MATPTLETKIWLALRARLETLVLAPPVPLLWPGETTDIPNGTSLEVTHMPNRPDRRFLKGIDPHWRRGILQVGVLTVPGAANHETFAREIAGDVAGHFPADLKMPYGDIRVTVSEAAEVGGAFRDTDRSRWVTPVTVRYSIFA